MNTIETGSLLEEVAARYLEKNNVLILHRNFRCKLGEIDIIAKDHNDLIFTEVRYRNNATFGSAAESVTLSKQQKIIRTAHFFVHTRNWAQNVNYRFDVLAISNSIESPTIEWIKDAFDA